MAWQGLSRASRALWLALCFLSRFPLSYLLEAPVSTLGLEEFLAALPQPGPHLLL